MTRIHRTSTALILAVAALGLGACGDDNKSDTGGDAATNEAIATDATTGTTDSKTGTTGTGTTKKTGTTKTNESKRDDKGGSGGGSGGGNSGSGNSGKRDKAEELTDKNVKSTAKTVCTSFLPKALERDLKSGDKSPEDIAKDYSRGFPQAQRKDAYEGCLSGLKSKD
jgi:hypothetical protein